MRAIAACTPTARSSVGTRAPSPPIASTHTNGSLTYLNKQSALGSILAHNSLDGTGRFVLVANYSVYAEPEDSLPDQAVVVMPIREDGGLGPPVSSHSHSGSGPKADRQERSHAHCALASPDNRHVLVADLGTDQLVVYRFDAASGALSPAPTSLKMKPGAGPRHFVFHPSSRFVYAINELDSTIAALTFDAASGALSHLHTVPALPSGHQRREPLRRRATNPRRALSLRVEPGPRQLSRLRRG